MMGASHRNPLTEELDVETLIKLGPVRPVNEVFKGTTILVGDRLKTLKFQAAWYSGRPWLQYSIDSDCACCYYCCMFQPKTNATLLIVWANL